MYKVGDKIIYGGNGVCVIEEICKPAFSREERDRQYYRLRPAYGSETIYAPLDTTVFMRPVMTGEEARSFIARIPEISASVCANRSITALRQQYESFFQDHDCETYVSLMKGVYHKGKEGKKLGQTDLRYRKRAEEVLYGELAAALNITPEEVPEFIHSLIGDQ